ncbi:hypothetical protein [Streptomyces sp. NPDC047028]|uniref:hypothetical protein n=1 Tax=Streptomyces sp. NPDC047028 TaxID=3155793 RepID=UPI0033DFBCFE
MSDHGDAEHAEFSEEDIHVVSTQGNVSREEAVKALAAASGDPLAALIELGR